APPPPGTDPVTVNRMVVDSMLGPASGGPEVDLVRQWASLTPPDTVKAAVKAVQSYPEAEAVAGFRSISIPTLLVAGEVDQVGHPAGMKRVADMILGCVVGTVSGSGHYPWAENPAGFNRHYFDFLDRHFPVSS
ncbi:MAG: alpha/beta fold hydrolase, partial [Burkholderiales bacterium]